MVWVRSLTMLTCTDGGIEAISARQLGLDPIDRAR